MEPESEQLKEATASTFGHGLHHFHTQNSDNIVIIHLLWCI